MTLPPWIAHFALPLQLPRKDWRPEDIVRLVTLVLMSWLVAIVAATVWAASRREQGGALPPWISLALVALAFHGVSLVAVALLVRREGRSWNEAFGLNRHAASALRLTVGSMLIVTPAIYLLHFASAMALRAIGIDPSPQDAVELLLKSGWAVRGVIAGFAVVLAPVVEELLFRGLLFPLFRDFGWPRLAWIGTSLLFGLIHANAAAFLPLSAFGLFLAWLYARTGNLLAPIAAHMLFNLIPFIALGSGIDLEL